MLQNKNIPSIKKTTGNTTSFSLGKQIVALWMLTILLMAVTLSLFAYNNRESVKRVDQLVSTDLGVMLGEKLKLSVDAMSFVISSALKNVSTPEAKKRIVDNLLKGFRFENDRSSYFFAYETYTTISTGNPKFHVGTSMENFQDKNGVYYIKDLYNAAMAGGKFVYYIAPKPLPDGGTRLCKRFLMHKKLKECPICGLEQGCIWTMCNSVPTRSPLILNTISAKNFTSMSWLF
ncbi:cache domain-containing protein [Helicobacter cynogastricus]|uniref:cache domain-containing protein n=1 Tax=Helicobacter cynogastricus TaxID=329937 RepID=UPI002D79F9BB|nr:cache domain-containing protein [Helicobacter cynogastricus]